MCVCVCVYAVCFQSAEFQADHTLANLPRRSARLAVLTASSLDSTVTESQQENLRTTHFRQPRHDELLTKYLQKMNKPSVAADNTGDSV